MTALELALDTFKYYEEDPSRRALDKNDLCVYLSDEGKKCAVGRWFDEKKAKHMGFSISDLINSYNGLCNSAANNFIDGRSILKDEVNDIPEEIWIFLQDWHDSPNLWNDTTESKIQRNALKDEILKKIKEKFVSL